MPNDRDPSRPDVPPPGPDVAPRGDEPEPDWAEEIRARRRARGDHLRKLFSTFGDERPPAGSDPGEPGP